MKRFVGIALATGALLLPRLGMAELDLSMQVQLDEQAVFDAVQDFRTAIMNQGVKSEETNSARLKVLAARKKLEIDTQRYKDLKQAALERSRTALNAPR